MKSTIVFDRTHDYGPPTRSIHELIDLYCSIDWFMAPTDPRAAHRASEHLIEYNTIAHGRAPSLFPRAFGHEVSTGGWERFHLLSQKVRNPGSWDWKFSSLKKLCKEHSEAKGWCLADVAADDADFDRRGKLFYRFRQHVMWALSPSLDARAVPAPWGETATWYVSYADGDVMFAIEWQLAEKSKSLDGNPFVPLLRCYAEGFLPFALDFHHFELFAFAP